ncbi:Hypotetical protein, putative [Plasmodium sp. DRC-Itaito]|nr:Hypotetical protein, putative [Plasmodium sp. DRC-Itaito]
MKIFFLIIIFLINNLFERNLVQCGKIPVSYVTKQIENIKNKIIQQRPKKKTNNNILKYIGITIMSILLTSAGFYYIAKNCNNNKVPKRKKKQENKSKNLKDINLIQSMEKKPMQMLLDENLKHLSEQIVDDIMIQAKDELSKKRLL